MPCECTTPGLPGAVLGTQNIYTVYITPISFFCKRFIGEVVKGI
jgi:hypothetical protein